MRQFYYQNELEFYLKIHKPSGFIPYTLAKVHEARLFLAGAALFPPLIMSLRVILDKRVRFLVVCLAVMLAGFAIEIFLIPHYVAPFMALFYALGLQAMRHLRVWRLDGQPFGLSASRLIIAVCVVMGGLRLFALPLHLNPPEWPPNNWLWNWYGPGDYGADRQNLEKDLEHRSGKHLVLVRYSAVHCPVDEWVYNAADIETSKVIWAREMDSANNRELIQYYKDRDVWLVEPDKHPAGLTPYPVASITH